jgi:hypothetical protein
MASPGAPGDQLPEFPGRFRHRPRFCLAAGTWEDMFRHDTDRVARAPRKQGVPAAFSSRMGGHDSGIWGEEFVAALLAAFGKK